MTDKKRFGLTQPCIDDIKTVFHRHTNVEEAVIFGSRAMGTYKNGSDIDIAIKGERLSFNDLLSLRVGLDSLPYAYTYDIIIYHKITTPELITHIDELGITFYKRLTSTLPDNWKTYKLEEICKNITDAREIKEDDFLDTHKGTKLESGDLLITNSGTIGRIAIVRDSEKEKGTTFQKGAVFIKPNNAIIIPYFLYYSLLCNKKELMNIGRGTIQQNLLLKDIRNFEVSIPKSLAKQTEIASILSSLDDKIELNLKMNQTLEDIARAIYKEWFVDFNFPGFDGQLVDGLPKGWKKYNLTELLDTVSITHKFPKDKAIFLNTSDILEGELMSRNYTDIGELPDQAKKTIKKGDILLSGIRPANKRYAYVDFEADDYVVSTRLMVLRSKGIADSLIIYFYLKNDEILNQLQALAETRSGTFSQITYSELAKLELNIPDEKTLEQYTEILQSLFSKIRINQNESKTLTQIRDSLLPKLITGKIEVKA